MEISKFNKNECDSNFYDNLKDGESTYHEN